MKHFTEHKFNELSDLIDQLSIYSEPDDLVDAIENAAHDLERDIKKNYVPRPDEAQTELAGESVGHDYRLVKNGTTYVVQHLGRENAVVSEPGDLNVEVFSYDYLDRAIERGEVEVKRPK